LTLASEHALRVQRLGDGEIAQSRERLTELLKQDPHLVYLYCHGGVGEGEEPFVEIGAPGQEPPISRAYLLNKEIRWEHGRPVVFINGCHTTALEPWQILDLVGAFVEQANAAGVIGTELTVFESLACSFAESMLEGFLDGSETVGAAVRHSRLALLSERNPLGLLYVPFIAAGTRLA
jgi:hypothetical protein